MQELAGHFVPAADEVWRLHHGKGPECDLFRVVAEQGHYAGRTVPSDTRQGVYAITPGGRLLASANAKDPRSIAALLEAALERWATVPEDERYLDPDRLDEDPLELRSERLRPADGLVLRVNSRDLPRAADERDTRRRRWRRRAWNQDYAWFRRAEMLRFVPDELEVGATTRLPRSLARRIVRLHLLDNVRGQTSPFEPGDVEVAELSSRVAAVEGERVTLTIEGRTRAVNPGLPAPEDPRAARNRAFHERGIETTVLGRAVFDGEVGRFVCFDLAAIGTRWGGSMYNSRERDPEPNGIGFAFTLARDDETVAPAFIRRYGWR